MKCEVGCRGGCVALWLCTLLTIEIKWVPPEIRSLIAWVPRRLFSFRFAVVIVPVGYLVNHLQANPHKMAGSGMMVCFVLTNVLSIFQTSLFVWHL